MLAVERTTKEISFQLSFESSEVFRSEVDLVKFEYSRIPISDYLKPVIIILTLRKLNNRLINDGEVIETNVL